MYITLKLNSYGSCLYIYWYLCLSFLSFLFIYVLVFMFIISQFSDSIITSFLIVSLPVF